MIRRVWTLVSILAVCAPAIAYAQAAPEDAPATPPAEAVVTPEGGDASGGAVAETPPTDAATTAAPAASAETPEVPDIYDLDPSLLMADASEEQGSRLDIFGFADFTYVKFFMPENSGWYAFLPRGSSMSVSNLNVYLQGKLSDRVRSLAEVRFLYLPHGTPTISPDGSIQRTNTTVEDPLEVGRDFKWGGITIERAWVEYEFSQYLVARVGQFLSPYGIWNVDHGSPAIIGARRPFVITETLIPERQTGIELWGRALLGDVGRLGYHFTLSNGRGRYSEYLDEDDNKAIGGRVHLTTSLVGELSLGASFFSGRNTERQVRLTQDMNGAVYPVFRTLRANDELALAFDLKWLWKGIHLQAEFVTSDRKFLEGGREKSSQVPYTAFIPDGRRWGMYQLLGYRFANWQLMPYVMLEDQSFASGDISRVSGFRAGLNYRPDPALVVKVEYLTAWFPDALPKSFGRDDIEMFTSQVAWVF